MRTLQDKIDYNEKLSTPFSKGYLEGVNDYITYGKVSLKNRPGREDKASKMNFIGKWGKRASLASESEIQHSKGYMCGMRDAAAECKRTK